MRLYTALLLRFALVVLGVTTLSRVFLGFQYLERLQAAQGWGYVLLQGLRFDLVLLGLLLIIPGVLLPWLLLSRRTADLGWRLTQLYLLAMVLVIGFLEFATPSFVEEYDTRPNYLFVEYLRYPKEVLATLWGAYPAQLLASAILLPALGFVLWKRVLRLPTERRPQSRLPVLGSVLAWVALCPLAIRSTLDHRAVNPSTVATSADAMVNTLPLPSAYTLAYALYETRLENEGGYHYGELPDAEVFAEVRRTAGIPADAEYPKQAPTLHEFVPSRKHERPLNLVIILQESLGAEFVGALGGPPITPRLDALAEEGLWFSQLYATGTRSVRGIEAVFTGFLPTPARSIVKLPRTQRGVFSLASLLAEQGYHTSFLYGGEAHFDNMARFFTGNGVQEIIDEKNFPEGGFVGSWGHCDGDLFRLAHESFSRWHAEGRPFCSLVFTSSNHSPFDFPYDGEFPLHEEPKATVRNAVKYADYAMGEFFDQARASEYWDDTVFLVVADHNSRVRGASLVPIQRFHIPGLFLGGTIEPEKIDSTCSQIDLLPTALSSIGVRGMIPCKGRDLTRPEMRALPGRAIMQYHDHQAYLEEGRVVVLRPDQQPLIGDWLPEATQIRPREEIEPQDPELVRRAIAHSLFPQLAYQYGLYVGAD